VFDRCTLGSGVCVKEPHCESYIASEAMWDLAARDLPWLGLDARSAWQVADELWYRSRAGSGGSAYYCSIFGSGGCGSTAWFTKLRLVDDDDGNMANGTPHAAAIFAAFERHKIARGRPTSPRTRTAADVRRSARLPCPARPAFVGDLDWGEVAGAASYRSSEATRVRRAFTPVATVTGTSYTAAGGRRSSVLHRPGGRSERGVQGRVVLLRLRHTSRRGGSRRDERVRVCVQDHDRGER
jgi:hypothetical protein